MYGLHLNFQKTEMPHGVEGRWPNMLQAHFQVLVLTNGVPSKNEDLKALHFNSSHDPALVRYGLTTFLVGKQTDVACVVKDVSDGKLKMHGYLVFERRFLK